MIEGGSAHNDLVAGCEFLPGPPKNNRLFGARRFKGVALDRTANYRRGGARLPAVKTPPCAARVEPAVSPSVGFRADRGVVRIGGERASVDISLHSALITSHRHSATSTNSGTPCPDFDEAQNELHSKTRGTAPRDIVPLQFISRRARPRGEAHRAKKCACRVEPRQTHHPRYPGGGGG